MRFRYPGARSRAESQALYRYDEAFLAWLVDPGSARSSQRLGAALQNLKQARAEFNEEGPPVAADDPEQNPSPTSGPTNKEKEVCDA